MEPGRVVAIALLFSATAAACSSEASTTACVAGDVRACMCDDGRDGTQHCGKTGERYSTCSCEAAADSGTDAADATPVGDASDTGTMADAKLPFLAPCAKNEECETDLCYAFPSKGPHCTKNCSGDAECPAPSTGCNPMGVCKVP